MSVRTTLFLGTLIQDSALSVSGLDRPSAADRPFTVCDGIPVLPGRGLKGAAVAMARRFFKEPLPSAVTEACTKRTELQRSAWEFRNARPLDLGGGAALPLRAGVGLLHRTSARAKGVLYDREVVPAGTQWGLQIAVDWTYAGAEGETVEGILGYILARHWTEGRCWLGGDVARGLGWFHLEALRAYRLEQEQHRDWVAAGRSIDRMNRAPEICEIPFSEPTRSWRFRTLDLKIRFGEYKPHPEQQAWGLDMLAIAPHSADLALQVAGSGTWASPQWASAPLSDAVSTDRALLMERDAPVLPGSSLRGALRAEFSRRSNAAGAAVQDPHLIQGAVGADDPAARIFGSAERSSSVLICDSHASGAWYAAKLHMHAEDEFSAGSYGSAKRDAVRLLKGEFPVRIVVEGATSDEVVALTDELDHLIALGVCGHLPVGGHRTRGAGWGTWTRPDYWQAADVDPDPQKVVAAPAWKPSTAPAHTPGEYAMPVPPSDNGAIASLMVQTAVLDMPRFNLQSAANGAKEVIGDLLEAWWCEPAINFNRRAPEVFGTSWPSQSLEIDEVAFFGKGCCWRAARTANGIRSIQIREVETGTADAEEVNVREIPARLHGGTGRFSAAPTGEGHWIIREWRDVFGGTIGFTLRSSEAK
jgi:CRISPR/Cas system CSM-associated protein Csm3 (group 7 of RAMP superfamily)